MPVEWMARIGSRFRHREPRTTGLYPAAPARAGMDMEQPNAVDSAMTYFARLVKELADNGEFS
jgi:hypothetical protein